MVTTDAQHQALASLPGPGPAVRTRCRLADAELRRRTFEVVEFATLEWVDGFNERRLLEPIGNILPAEAESAYYAQLEVAPIAA